jgi:hypothetical protein
VTSTRTTLAIVALALFMGGCASVGNSPGTTSGTPASGGHTGVIGACTLVDELDAATALGTTAGPGTEKTTTHSSQCVYAAGAIIVTIDDQGKGSFDTQHDAVRVSPAGTWSDVDGVGDGAFEVHAGPETTVTFYKGTTMVSILLSGSAGQSSTDAAIALAKAAAAHL